jgi:hypothetical protein
MSEIIKNPTTPEEVESLFNSRLAIGTVTLDGEKYIYEKGFAKTIYLEKFNRTSPTTREEVSFEDMAKNYTTIEFPDVPDKTRKLILSVHNKELRKILANEAEKKNLPLLSLDERNFEEDPLKEFIRAAENFESYKKKAAGAEENKKIKELLEIAKTTYAEDAYQKALAGEEKTSEPEKKRWEERGGFDIFFLNGRELEEGKEIAKGIIFSHSEVPKEKNGNPVMHMVISPELKDKHGLKSDKISIHLKELEQHADEHGKIMNPKGLLETINQKETTQKDFEKYAKKLANTAAADKHEVSWTGDKDKETFGDKAEEINQKVTSAREVYFEEYINDRRGSFWSSQASRLWGSLWGKAEKMDQNFKESPATALARKEYEQTLDQHLGEIKEKIAAPRKDGTTLTPEEQNKLMERYRRRFKIADQLEQEYRAFEDAQEKAYSSWMRTAKKKIDNLPPRVKASIGLLATSGMTAFAFSSGGFSAVLTRLGATAAGFAAGHTVRETFDKFHYKTQDSNKREKKEGKATAEREHGNITRLQNEFISIENTLKHMPSTDELEKLPENEQKELEEKSKKLYARMAEILKEGREHEKSLRKELGSIEWKIAELKERFNTEGMDPSAYKAERQKLVDQERKKKNIKALLSTIAAMGMAGTVRGFAIPDAGEYTPAETETTETGSGGSETNTTTEPPEETITKPAEEVEEKILNETKTDTAATESKQETITEPREEAAAITKTEKTPEWNSVPDAAKVVKDDGVTHIFKRQLDDEANSALVRAAEKKLDMTYKGNEKMFTYKLYEALKEQMHSDVPDGQDIGLRENPNNAYVLNLKDSGEIDLQEWKDGKLVTSDSATPQPIDTDKEYLMNAEKANNPGGSTPPREIPSDTFDIPDNKADGAAEASDKTLNDAEKKTNPADVFENKGEVADRVEKKMDEYFDEKKKGWRLEDGRKILYEKHVAPMNAKDVFEHLAGYEAGDFNIKDRKLEKLLPFLKDIYHEIETRGLQWRGWPDDITFDDALHMSEGADPSEFMDTPTTEAPVPDISPEFARYDYDQVFDIINVSSELTPDQASAILAYFKNAFEAAGSNKFETWMKAPMESLEYVDTRGSLAESPQALFKQAVEKISKGTLYSAGTSIGDVLDRSLENMGADTNVEMIASAA